MWTEVDTDDALELLGPGTVDSRVRAFAVRQLNRADDDVTIQFPILLLNSINGNAIGTHVVSTPARPSAQVRERRKRSAVVTLDDERNIIRRQWTLRLPD